jgi:hypothetical protein
VVDKKYDRTPFAFGLLKPNLMDILFPSFCSCMHASVVTV